MPTTRSRPSIPPGYGKSQGLTRKIAEDPERAERDTRARQTRGLDGLTEGRGQAGWSSGNKPKRSQGWLDARLHRQQYKAQCRDLLASNHEFSDEAASDDETVTIQDLVRPITAYPKGMGPKKCPDKSEKKGESSRATPPVTAKETPRPATPQQQERLTPLMKRSLLKDLDIAGRSLSEAQLKEHGLDNPNLSSDNRMWRLARMSREWAKTKILKMEGSEWEFSDAALSDDETVTTDYLIQPAQLYRKGTAPRRSAVLESGQKKKRTNKKEKKRSPASSPTTNTPVTPPTADTDAQLPSASSASNVHPTATDHIGHSHQSRPDDYEAFMRSLKAHRKAMKDDMGRHKVDDGDLPEGVRYGRYLRMLTERHKNNPGLIVDSAASLTFYSSCSYLRLFHTDRGVQSSSETVIESLERDPKRVIDEGDKGDKTGRCAASSSTTQSPTIETLHSGTRPKTNFATETADVHDRPGLPACLRGRGVEEARRTKSMGLESVDQALLRYGLDEEGLTKEEQASRMNKMFTEQRRTMQERNGYDVAAVAGGYEMTVNDMDRFLSSEAGKTMTRAMNQCDQQCAIKPPSLPLATAMTKPKSPLKSAPECTCAHILFQPPQAAPRRKVPPPAPLVTVPLYDDNEYPSSPASSSSSLLSNLSVEEQFHCNLVRSIRDEANRRGSALAKQFDLRLLAIFTMAYDSSRCPPPITACLGGEPVCRCCDYAYADTGIRFVHLIKSFSDPRQLKDGMWGLTPPQVEAIRGIIFVRFIAGWYDMEKDHPDMQALRSETQCTGKGKGKCI